MSKFSQLMSVSGQIVFRLRLAFLCVLLTLFLAGTVGGYQLAWLVNSQEDAINRAVPSLVTAHKLQSELATMLQLKERLRQADSVMVLTDLESRVKRSIRSLLSTVAKRAAESTSISPLATIGSGLEELDQLLSDSVPLRLKLIRGQAKLRQQRQALIDLRTRFHSHVEPQVIEAAFLLGETLDQPQSFSLLDNEFISSQVELQKNLSELSFQVMAVFDLAEQMTLRIGSNISAEGSVDLQFRLRSVAQILASLEDDPFRRKMALVLRQLYDLIQAEGGLVRELTILEGLEMSLDRLLTDQSVVVQSISQSVVNLVITARSEISVSSQAFSNALHQTLALLLIASLLIIGIIGYVWYHVVEGQIGRRMTRLTSAVLDIAEGDTKRVVAIEGDDEIGKMARALEVFKDNARQLHETSVEMEQFVYAAAHDLRSPLRVIESLAQWTIEDGDELPEDCLDNLRRILQRAQRLSTLQGDLLDYSRAGQTTDNLEMVNIASMVEELSDLLDPESRYSIQAIGQLPCVYTYETPLRQVLLNLLANAIKHHDGDRGKIEVRVQSSAERMSLSVKDDGAGIEARFQAQIFELFSTLQSRDDVEGSGLGLALILKLVSRYGGQVQVESNPEVARGATFTFDWPAQRAQAGSQPDSGPDMPLAIRRSRGLNSNDSPADESTDGDNDANWRNAS